MTFTRNTILIILREAIAHDTPGNIVAIQPGVCQHMQRRPYCSAASGLEWEMWQVLLGRVFSSVEMG